MGFWDVLVKYIIPILSFLGVGALITCYVKDKYESYKKNKEYIQKLKDDELDRKLRRVINEELTSIKADIVDIKNEEIKLKKSTTTLIRAHIDDLYNKAEAGSKKAVEDLINMTNDPIFEDDDQEYTKEKIRTIKGWNGIISKQVVQPAKAQKGKVNVNIKNKR